MARHSRFENLERDRPTRGEASRPASLERFEQPSGAPSGPATDAPRAGADALERFTADGTAAIATNDDALARLPSLECPACGLEGGKFERRCRGCDAALDGPAGRAHNLKRLAAFDAERAAESARAEARRALELADASAQAAATRAAWARQLDGVKDAQLEALGDGAVGAGALAGWIAIVVAAALTVALKGAASGFFGLVTTTLVLSRLPRGVLARLGRRGPGPR